MRRATPKSRPRASEQRDSGALSGLRIRSASLRDLLFVMRLADRVFKIYGPYDWILGSNFLRAEVYTLVAVQGDTRLGFAMLSPIAGPEVEVVELTALAVLPNRQTKGVGRVLLREAIGLAQQYGAHRVALHTATGNVKARSLFETEGFVIVDRLDGYYPEGQTALKMIRELQCADGDGGTRGKSLRRLGEG